MVSRTRYARVAEPSSFVNRPRHLYAHKLSAHERQIYTNILLLHVKIFRSWRSVADSLPVPCLPDVLLPALRVSSLQNAHVRRRCHKSHEPRESPNTWPNITNIWPSSCRPAITNSNSTTVCSRVVPVCQHHPMLYPLRIAANTIP